MGKEPIKSFRDLIAWQRGMDLAVEIISLTRKFPKEELFGLTSQLRRASASIPSNIAEGHGREGRDDYKKFLGYARGSLNETQTQLEIALRAGYLGPEDFERMLQLTNEIMKPLVGLIRSLRESPSPKT